MKERHKAVPASYCILVKEGKILLGLRKNTGYYDGWYTVPSGHVEGGELPKKAMTREAKEEIGITLREEDLTLVHTMYRIQHDATGDRADYFFMAEKWQGEPYNAEEQKCEHLDWFPFGNLPQNVVHHVALALEYWQKGIIYSEFPFTPEYLNPNKTG